MRSFRQNDSFKSGAAVIAALIALIMTSALFAGCITIVPSPAPEETEAPSAAPTEEAPSNDDGAKTVFIFEEGINAEDYDIEAISGRILQAGELLGLDMPRLTVNVSAELDRSPYAEDGTVFCSAEQLDSLGFYCAALTAAESDLPDWALRGAAFIALKGTSSFNYLKLGAVLKGGGQIDTLALLPTRFAPRFNNEKALTLSYRTAGALVDYIINRHGSFELSSAAEDKAEFIKELGLEEVYDGRYEGLLDGCGVEFDFLQDDLYVSNFIFPIVVMTDTYTLFAQPLVDCKNAEELEAFLYKLQVGKAAMREFIEAHASEHIDICEFDRHTNYYMLNEYGTSYALGNNVVLKLDADAVLHETVHQWIYPRGSDHWYYEGLADFLAIQGGEGSSMSFVHSMARLCFQHPDVYGGLNVADYNNIPVSMRVPGDEYTYDQSCSLIAYICENYTLDPIFAVAKNTGTLHYEEDFEAAFGISWEDLIADWMEWLGV